jgi:hypothetical protein
MKRIGAFLVGLLFTTSLWAQVGPLPGMAVLPPPMASGGCGLPVVTNVGTNANGTGNATVTVTGATVPAASLIIVAVAEGGAAAIGTVSDGVNTYSASPTVGVTSKFAIFYAPNASLSGGTITFTKNGSTHNAAMTVAYASNIATSSPLDTAVTVSTTATSSTPTVTSGTPAQSGELFIGVIGWTNSAAIFTQDSGNGWAAPPNNSGATGAEAIAGGSQVNVGTGTKTYAPTFSGAASLVEQVVGFQHC